MSTSEHKPTRLPTITELEALSARWIEHPERTTRITVRTRRPEDAETGFEPVSAAKRRTRALEPDHRPIFEGAVLAPPRRPRREPAEDAAAAPAGAVEAAEVPAAAIPVSLDTTTRRQGVSLRPGKIEAEQPTGRSRRERSPFSLPCDAFDPERYLIDLDEPRVHPVMFLVAGLLAALIGQGAGLFFFHGADAFNGAMLFTLCLLAGTVFPPFQRHAREVWLGRLTPAAANLGLILRLSALFGGIVLGYLVLPLVIGVERYLAAMGGAAALVEAERASLATLRFDAFNEILLVNLRVYLIFLLVGIVFRYLGILFVIIYNACQWGVIFAAAAGGGFVHDGRGALAGAAELAVTVAPHLLFEIAAYVVAAMAGVFLGRMALRYRPLSPKMRRLTVGILRLVAVGLVLVFLGAGAEALWAGWLAGSFYGGLQAPP